MAAEHHGYAPTLCLLVFLAVQLHGHAMSNQQVVPAPARNSTHRSEDASGQQWQAGRRASGHWGGQQRGRAGGQSCRQAGLTTGQLCILVGFVVAALDARGKHAQAIALHSSRGLREGHGPRCWHWAARLCLLAATTCQLCLLV